MTLDKKRQEMNEINEELLDLFIKRLELSKEIALIKSQEKLAIEDKDREREIIGQMTLKHSDYADSIERFFKYLFKESKRIQELFKDERE